MSDQLDHIIKLLVTLEKKTNITLDLLGVIITDQDHLNADIASLSADFTQIIADLKAQPAAPQLDFTAADALVAQVHAAVVPPPATDPAPASDAAPAVDASAAPPVDTSVATS